MLAQLSIKNYALIDDIQVDFSQGFTCITGETGAGKSILLGGLSLVLGKRADLSLLREKEKKCIIEAEFDLGRYGLSPFFTKHDLDHELLTLLRREILPSGKSRAFINDTPVTLDILSQLGQRLIDVHSQHQTLQLTENDFQLRLLDALARNTALLSEYGQKLRTYKQTLKERDRLIDFQKNEIKEHDYNSFLLRELEEASLEIDMQEELEDSYEQLNNVEQIQEELAKGKQLLQDEQVGLLALLTILRQASHKLAGFGKQYEALDKRIQSAYIELDDLAAELESHLEGVQSDPKRLEEVNGKLQRLYDLQKKHGVPDISELLLIQDKLSKTVALTANLDHQIAEVQQKVDVQKGDLDKVCETLRERRNSIIPKLKAQLEKDLSLLGMPSARFDISVSPSEDFKPSGKDNLRFLFSANTGTQFGELKKMASGGELSRIMLTIKSLLAQYENLPTIMFDEIDSGVSGEISGKMGEIMQRMSKNMQVFAITHLPQVASRGEHHYKVFKTEKSGITRTELKKLTREERIVELAEMLGGKEITDSAKAHARQLLNLAV
ncbi:MAG: DNA repair protein RecN [Bacteroidota bacterium]